MNADRMRASCGRRLGLFLHEAHKGPISKRRNIANPAKGIIVTRLCSSVPDSKVDQFASPSLGKPDSLIFPNQNVLPPYFAEF